MIVSGSRTSSSSRLSAIVKSDNAVMLVDGDGGAEDIGLGLLFEGISGASEGRVGGRDCSPTPGSPRDVATGVAAGSWGLGAVVLGFALQRIGGGGRPSQPFSRSLKTSCSP